jgi:GTPase SAR1 family protein
MMSQFVEVDEFCLLMFHCAGSGKSSFIHRYVKSTFPENNRATIGCDFLSTSILFAGKFKIRITIWDLSGLDRFLSIARVSVVTVDTIHSSRAHIVNVTGSL